MSRLRGIFSAPKEISGREGPGLGTWSAAAVASLVFALSLGLSYGVGNQNTYLLGGLRLAYPELLANDWLASQTTVYHKFFSYPAALLLHDSSGWYFAVANLLFALAGGLIIFLIARRLTNGKALLAVFLVVLGMNLVTRTFSASGSYLYDRVFQPSTIGSTGFLLACYFFLGKRYFYSGLALAVGGLFHANYLLLGFPVFLIAHLLADRERLPSKLLHQFAAPLIATAALLPTIISVVAGPNSSKSILLDVASPFHYAPRTFWWEFLPLIAWLVLWMTVVPREKILARKVEQGHALVMSLAILITGATLLTTVVYIPAVAQAYVWRLCPVLLLFLQLYVVSAAIRPLADMELVDMGTHPQWTRGCAAVVVTALAAVYLYLERTSDGLWVVLLLLMALGAVLLAPWARWRSLLFRARAYVLISAIAFAVVGGIALSDITERSSLLQAKDSDTQALYDWAQTTDLSAVFLIPPEMKSFRLAARRAVVIDERSIPFVASELEEWYSRLTDVLGGEGEAAVGYAHLDASQLETLARKYSVSYVVLPQPIASDPPPTWMIKYENPSFRVLRVTLQ